MSNKSQPSDSGVSQVSVKFQPGVAEESAACQQSDVDQHVSQYLVECCQIYQLSLSRHVNRKFRLIINLLMPNVYT